MFWTVGLLLFDMDLGHSPMAVILLSLIMVLMSSAFALMLATLARTQRAAGSAATVVSLVLAPLGGCWWPLFITPKWMQYLAKLTPHGWATTGFNKLLLFGADFSSVAPEMLAVLGFGVVFGVIATLRSRTSAVQCEPSLPPGTDSMELAAAISHLSRDVARYTQTRYHPARVSISEEVP